MRKNFSKRLTAIVMTLILLFTMVPTVLFTASAGVTPYYNPSPVFTDEAREEGAAAWLEDDGEIQVTFPAAEGALTYTAWRDGGSEHKAVDFYVVELRCLGPKTEKHWRGDEYIMYTKKVMHDASAPTQTTVLTPEEIAAGSTKIDIDFDMDNYRYNVSVTAVDEDEWFSTSMDALVSSTPAYVTKVQYNLLSTSSTAAREMFMMNSNQNANIADSETGGYITLKGAADQTGMEDPNNNYQDTAAFWLLTNGDPAGNMETVRLTYSRQHWDGAGAEEVWYWIDGSQVSLTGLSFEMYANNKYLTVKSPYTNTGSVSVSQTDGIKMTYSTRGYTGDDAYVWMLNDMGLWEQVNMTNGTIDLDHYTGYVRVPLDFICSTEASYVDANFYNTKSSESNFDAVYTTVKDKILLPGLDMSWNPQDHPGENRGVLVDEAGTPIEEAYLIQRYSYQKAYGNVFSNSTAAFPWYDSSYTNPATANDINSLTVNRFGNVEREWFTILARGLSSDQWSSGNYGSYIDRDTMQIVDTANTLRAVQDIVATGFSYTGLSEDSINKSIFVDGVLLYRSDGGQYNYDVNTGSDGYGISISTYYNEEHEFSKTIMEKIKKYLDNPNWTNYREVTYVENLIADIKSAYEKAGRSTDFLSEASLATFAAQNNYADEWANFLQARSLCEQYDTYQKNNSNAEDLVGDLVRILEKLPDPSTLNVIDITSNAEYYDYVLRLWTAYAILNYGQLKMLSGTQEQKILDYIALLQHDLRDSFIVGDRLANYPFIKFNDFEENVTLGERAWQLENDVNSLSTSTLASDYRHTKGLLTYAVESNNNAIGGNSYGRSWITDFDVNISTAIGGSNRYWMLINPGWGFVTDDGYMNTHGLSVTTDTNVLDKDFSESTGRFLTATVSKNSVSANNFDAFVANNMSAENLGGLVCAKSADEKAIKSDIESGGYMPLSLVCYVDFTEITDEFTFAFNIFTYYDGAHVKARFDMTTDSNYCVFYLLGEDGNWHKATNDYRYLFKSTSSTSGVTFCGYKGYIAIPLQHFKVYKIATDGMNALSRRAEALNNIYSIQFAISGGNLDGKTFTLDNFGFTYDPAYYNNLDDPSKISGRNDLTYAEVFDAKSSSASAFESMVASIDPFDSATLATAVSDAWASYNALSDYQKNNISSVATAYDQLMVYQGYVDNPSTMPHPTYSRTDLCSMIDALPSTLKNAKVTGVEGEVDYDLPYPGFDSDTGEVNYAYYGITAEQATRDMDGDGNLTATDFALEIIDWYETSYSRYSAYEKTQMGDYATQLIAAYNAASRCIGTLEAVKQDVTDFVDLLYPLYQGAAEDEGKYDELYRWSYAGVGEEGFVEGRINGEFFTVGDTTQGLDHLKSLSNVEYNELRYYAKKELNEGDALFAAFMGVTNGLGRIITNTSVHHFDNELESVYGGYYTYLWRYQDLYNSTKAKLDANETFTDAEWDYLCITVEEYFNLLPAYRQISELYEAIVDILMLFDSVDARNDTVNGTQTVNLRGDEISNNTDAEYFVSQYINFYHYKRTTNARTSGIDTDEDLKAYVRIKSENGALSNGAGVTAAYSVSLAGATFDASAIQSTPQTVVAVQNQATLDTVAVSVQMASVVDTPYLLTDILTIELVDAAGNVLTDVAGNSLVQTITVNYTSDDSYIVYIPAEIEVSWGSADAYDASYSIDTVLQAGASVSVTVKNDGTYKMNPTAGGTSDTLTYATANFGTPTQFTMMNTGAKPTLAPTITVGDWKVARTEYQTYLTYEVDYTAAP